MTAAPLAGPALRVRVLGVPVCVHWSFPGVGLGLGVPVAGVALLAERALVVELFAWCLAAVSLLVVLHELGHALVARLLSIEVHGVLFAAAGGCCLTDDPSSATHELAYSTARLACQAVVLVATGFVLVGALPSPAPDHAVAVFAGVNAVLIAANAWPVGGSDGHRIAGALGQWAAQRAQRAG